MSVKEIQSIKKLAEVVVNRCDKLLSELAVKQAPRQRKTIDRKTKYYAHKFKKSV